MNYYEEFIKFASETWEKETIEKALRNVYDNLVDPDDWNLFWWMLAEFIEQVLRDKFNEDFRVKIEPSSDRKWHYVIVDVKIPIGGKNRWVNILDWETFKWGNVADNENEFNEVINYIVDKVGKELETIHIE